MEAITDKSQVTKADIENLNALRKLFDTDESYKDLSKSINKLFYLYIQESLYRDDDILIEQDDVHNVLQVVDFLQSIKS